MPTIGSFHAKFWRARANPVIPPGKANGWMYPGWQSAVTMSLAIWGVSFDMLQPVWTQARWLWSLCRRLWWWRAPDQRARLERVLPGLAVLDREQMAVLERVLTLLQHAAWADAHDRVRICAVTPKFHKPEHWADYGRALKANAGQAQNVYRHVKVVHELRAASDISNPDAHLIAELAYQGMALMGEPRGPVEVVERTILAS